MPKSLKIILIIVLSFFILTIVSFFWLFNLDDRNKSMYKKFIYLRGELFFNDSDWVYHGVDLFSSGDYKEAIKFYDKALELNPENINAWIQKGISQQKLGQKEEANKSFHKAIECFDEILKNDPENIVLWMGKGDIFNNMGNVEEAIKCYDKVIEIKPSMTDNVTCEKTSIWLKKGEDLYSQGKYEDALNYFDKILDFNPEYAKGEYFETSAVENYETAGKTRGEILYRLGKYKDVINCFDEIFGEDLFWNISYIKGLALYKLKKYDNSIECFNKTLLSGPENTRTVLWKYLALYKSGNPKEAIKFFDKNVEIFNPGFTSEKAKDCYKKGLGLYKQKKYEETLKYFENALEQDKYTEDGHIAI